MTNPPVHIPWCGPGPLLDLAQLAGQRTAKTYCGRRVRLRDVAISSTKGADCPECRARYAADLRSTRAALRALRRVVV